MNKINDLSQELTDAIYTFTKHNVFITDTDTVIAGSGKLKKDYLNKSISNFIEKVCYFFVKNQVKALQKKLHYDKMNSMQ